MKISTIMRDAYILKIYMLVFSFFTPILIVLVGKSNGGTIDKIVLFLINIYLCGSLLSWSTKSVFSSYIKRWDNGREINYTLQWWFLKTVLAAFNGTWYILCINNNAGIKQWILYLIFYKISNSIVAGKVVISDNYFLYRNKIIILKDIQSYNIKERNVLALYYKDAYKYELKLKEPLLKEVKLKLTAETVNL